MNIAEPLIRIEERLESLLNVFKGLKEDLNKVNQSLDNLTVMGKPKEKKYRPYTLTEFVNEYSLGDEIILRRKDNRNSIKHRLFIEYAEDEKEIYLGYVWHTLKDLFNNYEVYTSKGWKPFGVEAEE